MTTRSDATNRNYFVSDRLKSLVWCYAALGSSPVVIVWSYAALGLLVGEAPRSNWRFYVPSTPQLPLLEGGGIGVRQK